MYKENVESLIADIFPNSKIKTIKLLHHARSDSFIVDIYGNVNKKIFIKYPKRIYDVNYVHKMNLIFQKGKKEEMISAPLIYHVDQEKRIFVMDYINGLNLHQLFTSIKLISQNELRRAIDLSAVALAEFHKIFKKNEHINEIDELVEDKDRKFINERIQKCNLNFQTQLFFDFAFGNIFFDPAASKLYLIDFPDKEHINTPHYDIATFRKDLYIYSQHPKFMLLTKWNNPSLIYDRFFSIYYNHFGIRPNENDELIIKYFSNNMIDETLKSYQNHKLKDFNIIKIFFIKRASRMNVFEDLE